MCPQSNDLKSCSNFIGQSQSQGKPKTVRSTTLYIISFLYHFISIIVSYYSSPHSCGSSHISLFDDPQTYYTCSWLRTCQSISLEQFLPSNCSPGPFRSIFQPLFYFKFQPLIVSLSLPIPSLFFILLLYQLSSSLEYKLHEGRNFFFSKHILSTNRNSLAST